MKFLQVARIGGRVVMALSGVALAVAAGAVSRGCTVAGRGLVAEPPALFRAVVASGPAWETARVTRIIDADTYVMLAGGQLLRVRLTGVDAPEHDQAFGAQASDSVSKLLNGRLVRLCRGSTDLYGRTLGSLAVPVGTTAAALAVDSLLVVRGWAWAFDPNRTVAGRAQQQLAAQHAGRGLWKCGVAEAVPPKAWRGFTATIKRRYQVSCTW